VLPLPKADALLVARATVASSAIPSNLDIRAIIWVYLGYSEIEPFIYFRPRNVSSAPAASVTASRGVTAMSYKETGQSITNYKADAKEAERNRKKLLLLIKQPGNNICADCPNKRAPQ